MNSAGVPLTLPTSTYATFNARPMSCVLCAPRYLATLLWLMIFRFASFRQLCGDTIVNTVGEKRVVFVWTKTFKWQDSNAGCRGQCSQQQLGYPKPARRRLSPVRARAPPFQQTLDCAVTIARDAPAAKRVGRQSSVREASVQDLRPVRQLSGNGHRARVPNIWHRLFPDRDRCPGARLRNLGAGFSVAC